jgi:large subunit ribosomal protein L10
MRPEKTLIVEDLRAKFQASPFLIITDYTGMTVPHFAELRNRLAAGGAKFSVVKNSFIKIAAKELGLPELALSGQTAVVTGDRDICGAAKVLKTFAKEFTKPVLRGGVLDNSALDATQIAALADLPSKEALQAQLLGLLLSPATKLVRTLNEPGASLARLLQALAEKGGGAPAAETKAAPAVEAPAEPAAEAAPVAEPAAEAAPVAEAPAPAAEEPKTDAAPEAV